MSMNHGQKKTEGQIAGVPYLGTFKSSEDAFHGVQAVKTSLE